MKKRASSLSAILFALALLLVLWANAGTQSSPIVKASASTLAANALSPNTLFANAPSAGNVPEGMYTIVGEGSHRCLDIPNGSCGVEGLQTYDCDPTEVSNSQKFNVVSDGSGNYTISPVHSDLCLEVFGEEDSGRTPVQQNVCTPGKISQKWSLSQFGANLEIRAVQNNQCLDIMRKATGNYGPVYLHSCINGTNQRWRLRKTTINVEKGMLCRASPSHPEYDCSGTDDKQKQVHLGKTLTKSRCEQACAASKMISCKWEGSK